MIHDMRKNLCDLSQYFSIVSLASLCCFAAVTEPQRLSQPGTQSIQPSLVAETLSANFGTAVQAVTGFKPFYAVGDFNGDGLEDLVTVVRLKDVRGAVPKDVRVLNPFELQGSTKFPDDPVAENRLALALVHGWKNPGSSGKFLLLGDSPILILQYTRATSSQTEDRKDLIRLMRRRGTRRQGETLPRGAKGDVILLATEVGGDSQLYWNGRTYLWQDSAED
jgi:hypothetical protein